MDTSDTADIAATYADAGGGYRNGSHDVVDGHILPPPRCLWRRPADHPPCSRVSIDRCASLGCAREKSGGVVVCCAAKCAMCVVDVQRPYVSVQQPGVGTW
jgi:hypothetical protein